MSIRNIVRKVQLSVGIKPGWQYRFIPYRPLRSERTQWDAEFRSGHWDGLRRTSEQPRYSVIAGYCHHFKFGGSVMDVGCGDGALQQNLSSYSYYLGIDLSAEAVRSASKRQNESTCFVQADAISYHPDRKFDVIIFNECLFYFDDPLKLIDRHQSFLEKDGIFIVSMYIMGLDRQIWNMIRNSYRTLAAVKLTSPESGISWQVRTLVTGVHSRRK